MKSLLAFVLLSSSLSIAAQETIKITAGNHNDFGIGYSLPTTLASVDISYTKHTLEKGPYYLYAEKYLGIKDIVTENQTYYVLGDISFDTKAKANTEESYLVLFDDANPPTFYLNDQNILLSINTSPSLPAESLTAATRVDSAAIISNYTAFDEELIVAGSTAKMAELAAKKIYHLRESRMDLITGNVDELPADGKSYEIIINQLKAQEDALMALFIGKTTQENFSSSIPIDPMKWDTKGILFRFSKYSGVVDVDDLSGIPYYLKSTVVTDMRPKSEVQIEENLKRRKKNKGVAYVIPGSIRLDLTSSNRHVKSYEMEVSQLGEIMQLPKSTFEDKKKTTSVVFNPFTGAIIELK